MSKAHATPTSVRVVALLALLACGGNGATDPTAPTGVADVSGAVSEIGPERGPLRGHPDMANALDYMSAEERQWVLTRSYPTAPAGRHVTVAIQAALNAARVVWFPAGEYRIAGTLKLNDGQVLFGAGVDRTVLKQYGTPAHTEGLLFIDAGGAHLQRRNIAVANLTLDGRSDVLGRSIRARFWHHLVSFSGVRDVLFERVKFRAARTAGVVLTTGPRERHNANVVFRRCIWDGINKSNWIAIQIGDCDGCRIEEPYITNWQLGGSEPGVILVEGPGGAAWPVFKNIHIVRGTLVDNGGAGSHGAINFVFASNLTSAPTDFSVVGTQIRGATSGGIQFNSQGNAGDAPASVAARHNFLVSGVFMTAIGRPFQIFGLRGGLIDSVRVENSTGPSYVGADGRNSDDAALPVGPKHNVADLTITRSRFYRCATGSGQDAAFRVHGVNRFTFDDNEVNECGDSKASTATALMFFGKSNSEPSPHVITSDYVKITRNRFIRGGRMQTAVGKHAHHRFTPENNEERGNDFGALVNQFQAARDR